jgi:radical SAM superfamily enzyme YgiQ (UPF0313 family)
MRLLLVGRLHSIEPLGVMHLAGAARDAGHDPEIFLTPDGQFDELIAHVETYRPPIVGFSAWTGTHRQLFRAADTLRSLGVKVAIGGPHATHFADDCAHHADWVVRGSGFRLLRQILDGQVAPGVHHDPERMAGGCPRPARDQIYQRYPALAASPIKSMMTSVGCPFACAYCYNVGYNALYGGFRSYHRPVDELIAEGQEIRDRWPAKMIYFQDDVMGLSVDWLREFSRRWPAEVGIPWHAQIRLELTRDRRRLDLFREGGCTGLTLAIENASPALRRYVLGRPMSDELIRDGCRRIQDHGMTLRTEQMLAVPFSDLASDLATLRLNVELKPDLAWASILAPYCGTVMGDLTKRLGFYEGDNSDLTDSFFDRSVLRHVRGGWRDVAETVQFAARPSTDNPLLRMRVFAGNRQRVTVGINGGTHSSVEFLNPEENDRYRDQCQILQRLFPWFARVPRGHLLARRYVDLPRRERTWARLGVFTRDHLRDSGINSLTWSIRLQREMGVESLTPDLMLNPCFFAMLPAAGVLARQFVETGVLDRPDFWRDVGTMVRHHLFTHALYRIEPSTPPILEVR